MFSSQWALLYEVHRYIRSNHNSYHFFSVIKYHFILIYKFKVVLLQFANGAFPAFWQCRQLPSLSIWRMKTNNREKLGIFFHSNWQIGVHCIFKTVHFWFHWFLINNSETIYFLDTNRITRFCMITNFFGLKMGKVGNTAFENAAGATNQVVLYHLLPLNFRPNLRHFKDLSLPFSDKKEIFANHICSQWIFQP